MKDTDTDAPRYYHPSSAGSMSSSVLDGMCSANTPSQPRPRFSGATKRITQLVPCSDADNFVLIGHLLVSDVWNPLTKVRWKHPAPGDDPFVAFR